MKKYCSTEIVTNDERNAIRAMFTADDGQPLKMAESKPRVALVPRQLIENLARVYEVGALKYGENSWRQFTPEQVNACLPDAAMRHLLAYLDGEEFDPETKLPHLACCGWNVLTILIINQGASK